MVLLPEGRIIKNPDRVKMVKVLPSPNGDATRFIVTVKLDDDSELMIDSYDSRQDAEVVADRCTALLNREDAQEAEDIGEVMASEEESSDWDFSDSEESAEKVEIKEEKEEESSDWDFSDSEDAEEAKPVIQPSSPAKKPKIQAPPTDQLVDEISQKPSKAMPKVHSDQNSVTAKQVTVTPAKVMVESASKTVPQIQESQPEEIQQSTPADISEIPEIKVWEDEDSDEWVLDNGLNDWY